MYRKSLVAGLLMALVFVLSSLSGRNPDRAEEVKRLYHQQGQQLEREIRQLQQQLETGGENELQRQFNKVRLIYKETETIIEYYFGFFAVKLNGPAIPFFEEEEPDLGEQQPAGMQVIEGILFPHYLAGKKEDLKTAIENLLADTRMMLQTSESNAFNDEFIFDAVTEELFRITTLGITGFDSQIAGNGLTECSAALNGLQKILLLYKPELKQEINTKGEKIFYLLAGAREYLQRHSDFARFDRMEFISTYLNPITKEVGEYKKLKGFGENKSPMFYSTIKKSNTLFAPGIFDVNKYLDDNTTSPAKIRLGKKLFFDKSLSKDNSRSCATCHDPAKAFSDGLPTSIAVDGHTSLPRNAPTIWNAALQRRLFMDNRSFSLEGQVMEVLNNAKEMHGSAEQAAGKILDQAGYKQLYAEAYPGAAKTDAANNICNAIACYERTLVAINSRFDRHMRGTPTLSRQEINGFNLFMGKAKCGTCHFVPLFSGAKPPRYYYNETEVIGVPDKNIKTNARLDEDEGRYLVTQLPVHKYAFKTPTLRNIALTAPYMHNGVFRTLEEVVDFYNNGGGSGLNIILPNQTLPGEKLNLDFQEKKSIIAFMKTLTDTSHTK